MKWLTLLLSAVLLAGCGTQTVIKTEVVTVERPVPFVPVPPTVPEFVSQVDNLTDEDVNDPGKVGQAYKYDMMFLRTLNAINISILQQYRQSSANFDKINQEIRDLITNINANETKSAEQAKTAAPTR